MLVRRPLQVFAFLLLLTIPQAVALVQQFREGYRPFTAAAHRVPFSWDMFAVRIERCDVAWAPPLPLADGPLSRLHESAKSLEWDFTLDSQTDYHNLAGWTCSAFRGTVRARISCYTPEGKVVPSVVACR
jgi:hypothetical protein